MTHRILDLFCGAGGAAVGYHRAGFEVVGVDIGPQPRYPFEFIQADAINVLIDLTDNGYCHYVGALSDYVAIHASAPCQFRTQMSATHRIAGFGKPNLLTPTRDLLLGMEVQFILENVPGAKREMNANLKLHGGMFPQLKVYRPRLFEVNFPVPQPSAPMPKEPVGVYGSRPMSGTQWTRQNGNLKGKYSPMRIARSVEEAREAMGMPWGTWNDVKEAVPPAYTKYVGSYLRQHLDSTSKQEAQ